MSEASSFVTVVEQQRKQASAATNAVLDWGIGSLLNAQADLLAGAESAMTDWLHRRREAVVDARNLIAHMHVGVEPGEAVKAQQEWISRSLRRLAADAESCHSVTWRLFEHAPAWFPRDGLAGSSSEPAASESAPSQAAATRAATRPLRMANQSE